MITDYSQLRINLDDTIITAINRFDNSDRKLLLICDEERFVGLLTLNDIQQAIITDKQLNLKISEIYSKIIKINPFESKESIRNNILEHKLDFYPVLDENNNIIDVYYWENFFEKQGPDSYFDLPVVVMAGGYGTRLRPLTNVLPKPLFPVYEKTIIEEIFKRFSEYGCKSFLLSLNYKAELIKYYLEHQKLPYDFDFFVEDKPLGTAGSLTLMKESLGETFFVTNCDILIDQDYSRILKYHYQSNNEITLVSSINNSQFAYGTVETRQNGELTALIEKPTVTYKINTGMYILNRKVIDEIPYNTFLNITDLIEKLLLQKRKVGAFPILQSNWIDIGDWDAYLKIIKPIKMQ
jgi:dTDP-glucose pyrophosphorylase